MYFIGCVTLFFANNSLTECRIAIELLHSFLVSEVILSSHEIFNESSTKEFTPVNNSISSYGITFKH